MVRETHRLEERYFERMAKSLGDKLQIVEQLPTPTDSYSPKVLDIGAGGGEFAHALTELGFTVTALDASADAVEHMKTNFPKLHAVQLLANHAEELGLESYDAVICSSILHEVFSYGDDERGRGDYNSLTEALKAFNTVLKPGGVLVIRDGVRPRYWNDTATVTVLNGDDEAVTAYLNQCPFANGSIPGAIGRLVELTKERDGSYTGNLRSVYEFYMTYNWGVENYHREAHELYGVLSLDQYASLLDYVGFKVELAKSWVQPGYVEHLPKKVRLMTAEGFNRWPETNALWVARKPATNKEEGV
jgi:SAM-dependent methyltransferase